MVLQNYLDKGVIYPVLSNDVFLENYDKVGIELDRVFNACKDRSKRRMRDTRTTCVPDVAFQHKWEER